MQLSNYQHSLLKSIALEMSLEGLIDFLDSLADSLPSHQQDTLRRVTVFQLTAWHAPPPEPPEPEDTELDEEYHLRNLLEAAPRPGSEINWPKFLLLLEEIGAAIPTGSLLRTWGDLEARLAGGSWVATPDPEPPALVPEPELLVTLAGSSSCADSGTTCLAPLPPPTPDPDALLLPDGWVTVHRNFGVLFARTDGLAQVEPRDVNGRSFDVYTQPTRFAGLKRVKGKKPETVRAALQLAERTLRRGKTIIGEEQK